MVRGVVFDLDGTLVDSAGDLQATLNALLREHQLAELDLLAVKSMIGDGVAKLVERAFQATGGDPNKVGEAAERFLVLYEGNAAARTVPYPGVRETLQKLVTAGFTLGVVTNKPYAATMEILNALNLTKYFSAVVGGDSAERRKPFPDPVLKILRDTGLNPSETLMVGDNYHDVEAAHAAGLRAIMVTYGYSHKPPAIVGADHIVEAMPEILAVVDV